MKKTALVIAILSILALGLIAAKMINSPRAPLVEVSMPELNDQLRIGQSLFAANCAKCHGDNAAGNDGAGPPLIHKIYEPSHHGDDAFLYAIANGVRAHHWRFGNMPKRNVSIDDAKEIIAFVRAVQRANGID